MIVNSNVLIISTSLVFVGLAFGERVLPFQAKVILIIPTIIGIVGIALTQTLFKLYAACIERLIRFEKLLGCFDPIKFNFIDQNGSLLPLSLMVPHFRPILSGGLPVADGSLPFSRHSQRRCRLRCRFRMITFMRTDVAGLINTLPLGRAAPPLEACYCFP
jgi:hypothetical protein